MLPARSRRSPRVAVPAVVLGLLLALQLGLSACSSDTSSHPSAPASAGASDRSAPAWKSRVGKVTVVGKKGGLSAKGRRTLVADVQRVVGRWVDAAYLGSYPRKDFSDAFPGFTQRAASRARHDSALMSNAAVGSRLTSVALRQRRLQVDTLVVHGHPTSVTARVALGFDLTGKDLDRRDHVIGRLLLTPVKGGWKVFGYSIKREQKREKN